jgi:hypothetical protein
MPSPPPHLRFMVSQDGAVILDIPRNKMVTLNATGGYIWEKLQRGKAVEDVVRELSMETNTDPHIVRRDVNSFLEQLMSKHLLHD